MVPIKRESPTGFWQFCAHCFDAILSRDGVAWCLLITLAGGFVYGGIRCVELVGPTAARWLETSANTTASLGENMILLTSMAAEQKNVSTTTAAAVLVNATKIDADIASLRELSENGSKPARETAAAMEAAAELMKDVPAQRDIQNKLLEDIKGIQTQVLEVLKARDAREAKP